MKIYIIRHGDPDYPNHTLTETGFREAEALGEYYSADDFDVVYCSPLPRARLTADAVIRNRKPIHVIEDFHEFSCPVQVNGVPHGDWDFTPEFLDEHRDMLTDKCLESDVMKSGNVREGYDRIIRIFDDILKENGYERQGTYYRVNDSNDRSIAIFCHLGLMGVLASRLTNVPYLVYTQYFSPAPSSVTLFVSEEREQGKAQFRCQFYGDTAHLTKKGLKPSFSGRFCERFSDDTRH